MIGEIRKALAIMSKKELQTVMMATLSALKEIAKKEVLEKVQSFVIGEPVAFTCKKKASSFFGKQVTGVLKSIDEKRALVEAPDKGTWSVTPMSLQKVG